MNECVHVDIVCTWLCRYGWQYVGLYLYICMCGCGCLDFVLPEPMSMSLSPPMSLSLYVWLHVFSSDCAFQYLCMYFYSILSCAGVLGYYLPSKHQFSNGDLGREDGCCYFLFFFVFLIVVSSNSPHIKHFRNQELGDSTYFQKRREQSVVMSPCLYLSLCRFLCVLLCLRVYSFVWFHLCMSAYTSMCDYMCSFLPNISS